MTRGKKKKHPSDLFPANGRVSIQIDHVSMSRKAARAVSIASLVPNVKALYMKTPFAVPIGVAPISFWQKKPYKTAKAGVMTLGVLQKGLSRGAKPLTLEAHAMKPGTHYCSRSKPRSM